MLVQALTGPPGLEGSNVAGSGAGFPDFGTMSEEDQIAYAIQMSMQEAGKCIMPSWSYHFLLISTFTNRFLNCAERESSSKADDKKDKKKEGEKDDEKRKEGGEDPMDVDMEVCEIVNRI